MTDLKSKITAQIKKQHISQRPRLYFVLKNCGFWLLFSLAVLVGAATFAMILYIFLEADFEVLRYMSSSDFGFFLVTLPLYWLVFFGLFFLLAFYSVRQTKKGYRFPFARLVVGNLILSILFGLAFYQWVGAEMIEQQLAQAMPFYKGIEHRRREVWSHPREGFLAGTVIQSLPEQHLLMVDDFQGQSWNVDIGAVREIHPLIRAQLEQGILEGVRIKVLGDPTGEQAIVARLLLPWERMKPRGMQLRRDDSVPDDERRESALPPFPHRNMPLHYLDQIPE